MRRRWGATCGIRSQKTTKQKPACLREAREPESASVQRQPNHLENEQRWFLEDLRVRPEASDKNLSQRQIAVVFIISCPRRRRSLSEASSHERVRILRCPLT